MSAIIGSLNDFDLPAMERAAYQRGDSFLAELLQRLIDAEDQRTEDERLADEQAEEAKQQASSLESDLQDLRVAARDRIANLEALFEGGKHSNRDEIDEAIKALYEAVE